MVLFQTLDGDVYERMQEYFTLFCQSELHSCGVTQELFMKILSDATKVRLQCLADMGVIMMIIKLLFILSIVWTKNDCENTPMYRPLMELSLS